MTVLEQLRATLRTVLPADVALPEDDEGLTRYVVSGDLDLDEFYDELAQSVEGLSGGFPEEEPFFRSEIAHLSAPQLAALSWLAPVSRHAENLRASAGWSCDDPTLGSLARSNEEGRIVSSGLVWREEPPAARTAGDAVLAGRNLLLGSYVAAAGFGVLDVLTCRPVCRACPVSPVEVLADAWPVTGGFAVGLAALILLPGVLLLARGAVATAVPAR